MTTATRPRLDQHPAIEHLPTLQPVRVVTEPSLPKTRVAVYARVSTNEELQDPRGQILAIEGHCSAHPELQIVGEPYVDYAKATDLRGRVAWRQLLTDAGRNRFDAVIVFKLDRAFRSVKHMHETLSALEVARVDFMSVREALDSSTAMGRFYMNLLASLAELELGVISERILAGMDRARTHGTRSGKAIGRPRVQVAADDVAAARAAGMSIRKMAKEFGVSKATIGKLLKEAQDVN